MPLKEKSARDFFGAGVITKGIDGILETNAGLRPAFVEQRAPGYGHKFLSKSRTRGRPAFLRKAKERQS